MSDFKKVSSKNELYIGFVDDQDKYDRFGFCRNNSFEYFGQYKCGIRDGYGAFKERGSEGSIVLGEIFNDSINGIGIQYKRGVVYFGYFYNGIFESGFTLGNELSFISKKHNNYELSLSHITKDNYKFKLVKYNNDELEESETKQIEICNGFGGSVQMLKLDFSKLSFVINDSPITKKGDFYGSIYSSYGLVLDKASWNIFVSDNNIIEGECYNILFFSNIII